jgi:DNA-binding NtrC family response regulator
MGRLLIVDDEAGIIDILTKILTPNVREIAFASNGIEALEKIKTETFDAVLSDINMPKMDGLELLARVRAAQMEIPFVFLTGFGDREKTREALRLGATDFLDKPFEPETVIDVIGKALELGQTMAAVEAELENLYTSSEIPADKRIKLRKMKQAVVMMRYSVEIYKK